MLPMIPVAAFATVALMGVFARQNQKTGWVKQRKSLLEALRETKAALLTAPPAIERQPVAWFSGLPVDPQGFSDQLRHLQVSLDRANRPVIAKTRAAERETETVKVSS